MVEDSDHQDDESADTGAKWVWLSTAESVERGTISALACAEVVAGILLYWWVIPWWLGTNLHLLISVLVVPLLLLRSPASIQSALTAFERYSRRREVVSTRSPLGIALVLLAAGLSALASWGLGQAWLGGHEGWSLFWRASIIGWIGLQIALGATAAAASAGATAAAATAAAAAAVAAAAAAAAAVAGAVAGAAAAAGAVAGPATPVGALLGVWIGVWFRSIIIKFGSTVRHVAEGAAEFSVNWRALVWAQDFRQPPELLPGIERYPRLHGFTIRTLLSAYKFKTRPERVLNVFFAIVCFPIFFLPAWFYRLSLKSTCWFWWPLVFSQTSGRAAAGAVAKDGVPGADVVFEEQSKTWLAKLLFGLSLIILVATLGVPESVLAVLPVSREGVDLLSAVGHTIDLMLPCAVVQLILFLLCDLFLARAKAGHLGPGPRTVFHWLVRLRQFLLWGALFVALALYIKNWVPVLAPFAELVETHYFSWFPILK